VTPRHLLESARHGFCHGMMEGVLNDESENISLSQLLDIRTQQLILEEVQHNNRFSLSSFNTSSIIHGKIRAAHFPADV
jgi:hypothetical protein